MMTPTSAIEFLIWLLIAASLIAVLANGAPAAGCR
jgi:hypothetical protein